MVAEMEWCCHPVQERAVCPPDFSSLLSGNMLCCRECQGSGMRKCERHFSLTAVLVQFGASIWTTQGNIYKHLPASLTSVISHHNHHSPYKGTAPLFRTLPMWAHMALASLGARSLPAKAWSCQSRGVNTSWHIFPLSCKWSCLSGEVYLSETLPVSGHQLSLPSA